MLTVKIARLDISITEGIDSTNTTYMFHSLECLSQTFLYKVNPTSRVPRCRSAITFYPYHSTPLQVYKIDLLIHVITSRASNCSNDSSQIS